MKKYIVLFREPDGRTNQHTEGEMKEHQENWKNWFSLWREKGKILGGSGLTLNGRIIKGNGTMVSKAIHKNGKEIVGGYLLLNASDFDEAAEIMKSCPIYDFSGYSEIRELQNQK